MSTNLKARILSAIAALLIIFGVYFFFSTTGLIVFSCIVVLIGCSEYFTIALSQKFSNSHFFRIFFLICTTIPLLSLKFPQHTQGILTLSFILWFLGLIFSHINVSDQQNLFQKINLGTLGLAYTAALPLYSIKILNDFDIDFGMKAFFGLLVIIFSGDIFAYITGKLFGKRKLAPHISPKKTKEGSFGGLVASASFSTLYFSLWLGVINPLPAFLLGVLCGISAQAGDLFESVIKRSNSVKDSGRIMPGHGGVLDRLDGVYFAAPILFIYFDLLY